MALQDTILAADAVVLLINAAITADDIEEDIAPFTRVFVPEFEKDNLAVPKGEVFPAGMDISKADRRSDNEDSVIEIGVGRRMTGADAETTDVETQLLTVQQVKDELRKKENQFLTLDGGDQLQFRKVAITLFVPELFRKGIALSVVQVTYRGFSE